MTVEVAFGTPPADEPGAGDWTDISSHLIEPVTTSRGQSGGGTGDSWATFQLDNRSGSLDPTLENPRLVRHCRVSLDGNPLFRGLTADWRPLWAYNDARISVRLTDAFGWLSLQDFDVDLPTQDPAARITALLNQAGWPSGLRDIEAGVVRLEPLEVESGNARRMVEDAADAEDGDLHVDRQGRIRFRSRHDRFDRSSVATAAGDGAVGDLPLAEGIEPSWSTDELVNVCRVELDDGRVFVAEDPVSVASFGPRNRPIRDLALPKVEAVALAEWEVYRYSQPSLWAGSTPILVEGDPAAALAVEIGDLVEIKHAPTGGTVQTIIGHVERIIDRVEAGRFVMTWDVSPYFGQGPWLEWLSDVALTGEAWLSDVATEGGKWAP